MVSKQNMERYINLSHSADTINWIFDIVIDTTLEKTLPSIGRLSSADGN